MKFSIKDFFSKYDQIRKRSLMKSFIFLSSVSRNESKKKDRPKKFIWNNSIFPVTQPAHTCSKIIIETLE